MVKKILSSKFRSQSSMADSASKEDMLPKPNFKNGRFEIPWDNPGYPSSWNVLKFMTVHKNESNVPSQQVCPKFITFGIYLENISQNNAMPSVPGDASDKFC